MAPEQVRGDHTAIGPRTDVYALGVILYEMLSGRVPFNGPGEIVLLDQILKAEPMSLRALRRDVPANLETICRKAMAKEPSRRYASARELADDLRRFRLGEPIKAHPVGPLTASWLWARRNPRVALLCAAVYALIGIATALSAYFVVRTVR